MLKNILLQFTDLHNITWMYCREEDKLSVCIKTTPSFIQKKEIKTLLFAFQQLLLYLEFMNLRFPIKYHPTTLERHLNYPKWFATMSVSQSNNLSTILCHQSFLVQCLSSTYWKLLPSLFKKHFIFFFEF